MLRHAMPCLSTNLLQNIALRNDVMLLIDMHAYQYFMECYLYIVYDMRILCYRATVRAKLSYDMLLHHACYTIQFCFRLLRYAMGRNIVFIFMLYYADLYYVFLAFYYIVLFYASL